MITPAQREYRRQWQIDNKEKCAAAVARWRAAHPEEAAASAARYRANNPKKGTHDQAIRRARALNAVPYWVDRNALRKFYDQCPPGLEVDHIVPLKHDTCCGLHVPWNLQYLTRRENAQKNKHLNLERT